MDRLLKKIDSTGVTERPKGSNRPRSVRTTEFREKIELVEELICSRENALRVYENPYKIGREMDIIMVVCSAHCKARSSAENLQALVRLAVIR